MRRDYFTLDVRNVDPDDGDGGARKPSVIIDFTGPSGMFRERLTGFDDDLLDAKEVDVAFRLQTPIDQPDAMGVVGVTNRITGDFILELNADADNVLQFIGAARRYGKEADGRDGRYRIEMLIDGRSAVSYDKSTFLVYNSEGNLLRQHSLIPSGVEL